MKFAICNEMFGDWPWEKGLELARSIGYTGVEVAPFTLGSSAYDISAQTREAYRKAVQESGMEVIGLHWLLAKTEGYHLTTRDESVRRKTSLYLKELIKLCSDLGGSVMVLGSPLQRNFPSDMTHDQAMENAADVLRPLHNDLVNHGVAIAIEPLGPVEGNFLNTASDGVQLVDMIQSPSVRLHLDVKAMSSEAIPIDQIVRDNAHYMIHFHANDANRLGPGMGEIDQRPIFKALKDIQYQGWVSVEVFDYSPGIEYILKQSWDGMQKALQFSR